MSRLVTAAAREHLAPRGLRPRGRWLWIDDRGWSLIIVEFAPDRGLGVHLNVGAMWLWTDRDHFAFDDGDRVWWRADGTFTTTVSPGEPGWNSTLDHITPHRFARDIDMVADVAARRVAQLRSRFPDPRTAAHHLNARPARLAESRWWHLYHQGAAAGLSGDTDTARRAFDGITPDRLEADWQHHLAHRAAELSALADDPTALRARLVETVHTTRQNLALPATPHMPHM